MVNFSILTNVSVLDFNTTMIENNEELLPTMINNANEQTSGYLGLAILLVVFLVLTYINFRQDDDIRLDIVRSIFISSGFSSILGIIMIVSGLITSFQHVTWFILVFLISLISVYFMKRKGG